MSRDQSEGTSSESKEEECDITSTAVDLSATLGAFAVRIQRKKKEQQQQSTVSAVQTKVRHSILLEALMSIRRSLSELLKIDLGDRFSFSLEVDDWQGWPRLAIRLIDSIFPDAEYPAFTVHARDRNGRGVLEISAGNPEKAERLTIAQEPDLAAVPLVLKKCVRSYLDLIAEIILKSEKDNHKEIQREEKLLKQKDLTEFEEKKQSPALSGDLYEDDIFDTAVLESLPSLQELEALPEVFSSAPTTGGEDQKPQANCYFAIGSTVKG